MSSGTAIDLGLTEAYNDLFSTWEERDNAGRTFVIDPAEISDFPNHPFHAQAIKMRNFSEEGKLNSDVILSIMQEERPTQVEQSALTRPWQFPRPPLSLPPQNLLYRLKKGTLRYFWLHLCAR